MIIKTFKDEDIERLFKEEKISQKSNLFVIRKVIIRKVHLILSAQNLNDLRIPPNNRLKKLSSGEWSIRVNEKYRITFYEEKNELYDLNITNHYDD